MLLLYTHHHDSDWEMNKMNIELLDMSRMTLLAKYYMKNRQVASSLVESADIEIRRFRFAPLQAEGTAVESDSCEEWLKELSRRGATDCKLIVPLELDSFDRLNRPNGIRCCMICFYGDRATSWNKLWTYNPIKGKWIVQYVEIPVRQTNEKPVFHDVSENMAVLLERLRDLARNLKLSEYSFRFAAALKALQSDYIAAEFTEPTYSRLMKAATEAYVFDGKEPWTETAKFAAAGKGLSEEYDALTRELYRGIALSVMYAVNEW